MPHCANNLGLASDDSGVGLLEDLAVINELKIDAGTQGSFKKEALFQDVDKLALLLTEIHPDQSGLPCTTCPHLCPRQPQHKQVHYTDLQAYCDASCAVNCSRPQPRSALPNHGTPTPQLIYNYVVGMRDKAFTASANCSILSTMWPFCKPWELRPMSPGLKCSTRLGTNRGFVLLTQGQRSASSPL